MRARLVVGLALVVACKSAARTTTEATVAEAPATAIAETPAPVANGAAFAVGVPRFGLGARATQAAFSPDGTLVAACGEGFIGVWNVADGLPVRRSRGIGTCGPIAWAGSKIVVVPGDASKYLVRLDLTKAGTEAELVNLDDVRILDVAPLDAMSVVVATDRGVEAWAVAGRFPSTPMWPVDHVDRVQAAGGVVAAYVYPTVKLYGVGEGCSPEVKSEHHFALAPDGRTLAFIRDGRVVQIDTTTCAERGSQPLPPNKYVNRLVIGAGAQVSITVDEHPLWSVIPAPFTAPVVEVPGEVLAIAPDGRVAVATATGLAVHATGEATQLRHYETVTSIAVRPDGTVVTASGDRAIVWTKRGVERDGVAAPSSVLGTAVNSEGTQVALLLDPTPDENRIDNMIDIIDLATRKRVKRADAPKSLLAWAGPRLFDVDDSARASDSPLSFVTGASRDGRRRAQLTFHPSRSPQLLLWDEDTELDVPDAVASDLYDVEQIAIGARTFCMVVDDADDPEPRSVAYSLPSFAPLASSTLLRSATAVTLRPGSEAIVIGTRDGAIHVLDAAGAATKTFTSGAGRVVALAVSSDDKLLASTHADGATFVWPL